MNSHLAWIWVPVLLAGCTAPPPTPPTPVVPPGPELTFPMAKARLLQALDEQVFPGGSIAVGTSDRVLWLEGFGRLSQAEDAAAVDLDTVYDLASLTKVSGTTGVLLKLVAAGRLNPAEPVGRYLPEFLPAGTEKDTEWRRSLTVAHLMAHVGGLVSWKPFYKSVGSYDALIQAIVATPMEAEPGTRYKYSDPGFILLGEIAARAGGKPLPDLEQELLFEPLGMVATRRNPPAAWLPRIAPTERNPDGPGFLHGVVHDENARSGEGITGHAGLFSSARDMARLAQAWLRAAQGKRGWLPPDTVAAFLQVPFQTAAPQRVHGWGLPGHSSSGGTMMSPRAFGHTGFTGTSIWMDPQQDLFVVLLTNRVHPTRENSRIAAVRRDVADAVVTVLRAAKAGAAPGAGAGG